MNTHEGEGYAIIRCLRCPWNLTVTFKSVGSAEEASMLAYKHTLERHPEDIDADNPETMREVLTDLHATGQDITIIG